MRAQKPGGGSICAWALVVIALACSRSCAWADEASLASLQQQVAAREMALNGVWQHAYTNSLTPPKRALWRDVEVPGFLSAVPNKRVVWYRREFRVPSDFGGKRVILCFEGVQHTSVVYLNGRKLGVHEDGYIPFECDVTGLIEEKNTLLVGAGDASTCTLNGKNLQAAVPTLVASEDNSLMRPVGSRSGRLGIWQHVKLITVSDVRITDAFVTTSVREGRIEAQVELKNLARRTANVSVQATVYDEQGPVRELGQESLSLDSGETGTLRFEKHWRDARLWSLDQPNLYWLVVRAGNAVRLARFGFREVWTEGDKFYLNGTPMALLGSSIHPRGFTREEALADFRTAREHGCVIMRLHAQPYPKWFYEAADEMGFLIAWESAYWCYSKAYRVGDDAFWRNFAEHLTGQVKLHRNSPSVVIWSVENELLLCGAQPPKQVEKRLSDMAGVIRSLDPTRPIMFEGDGDPAGAADIVNLHYPHEFPRNHLYPRDAWWLADGAKLDTYPKTFWKPDRAKPLYIGEFGWSLARFPGPYSTMLGDEAFRNPRWANLQAKALSWEPQLVAYRMGGVAGLCPWNMFEGDGFPNPLGEAVKRAYAPAACFLLERDTNFYSEEEVSRTFLVANDTGQTGDFTIELELEAPDIGVQLGSWHVNLETTGRRRLPVRVRMPGVSRQTHAKLVWRLVSDGKAACEGSRSCSLFPRALAPARVSRPVDIWSDDGDLRQSLKVLGVDVRHVRDASDLSGSEGILLARGKIGLDVTRLLRLLDDGWRIGVLELEPGSSVLGVKPYEGLNANIAFVRDPSSALTRDLTNKMLSHWRSPVEEGNLVVRNGLFRGLGAAVTGVIDAGWSGNQGDGFFASLDTGVRNIGLGYVQSGNGTIVFCQMPVISLFDKEPAAAIVLRNALRFLDAGAPSNRRLRLVAGGESAERIGARLVAAGIEFSMAPKIAPNGAEEVLLIDGASAKAPYQNVRQVLADGGSVILHGLEPGQLREWDYPFEGVVLEPVGAFPVSVRPEMDRETSVMNQDLHWVTRGTGRSWFVPFDPDPEIARFAVVARHDVTNAAKIPVSEFRLTDSSVAPRRERSQIVFFAPGGFAVELDAPSEGEYLVGVEARGTSVGAVYPVLTLYVDGLADGRIYVGSDRFATHYARMTLQAGRHQVRFFFSNDRYEPPEDRNVFIRSVLWARAPARDPFDAITDPAVLARLPVGKGFVYVDQVRWDNDTPSALQANDYLKHLLATVGVRPELKLTVTVPPKAFKKLKGQLVHISESEITMSTNCLLRAVFEVEVPGRYTVSVPARGKPAMGQWPILALGVDGTSPTTFRVESSGFLPYNLTADFARGRHTIEIAFTNDAYRPPEDRNLWTGAIALVREGH